MNHDKKEREHISSICYEDKKKIQNRYACDHTAIYLNEVAQRTSPSRSQLYPSRTKIPLGAF